MKRSQEMLTERAVKSVQKAVEKESKTAEALGFGSKKSLSKAQSMLKVTSQTHSRMLSIC